jgi:hypothetical protein
MSRIPNSPKTALLCAAGLALAALAQPLAARTIATNFVAANFTNPLNITNIYFPLVPGTTYVYRADNEDGCEVDRTTVTNDTRVLAGVTVRVVHDVVYQGRTCTSGLQRIEDTFDYYAQDNAGNVWYMGEDTFDCTPNGCARGEGGWLAGVNGARPGIIMLAQPRSGDAYQQEFSPGNAQDQALVTAVGVNEVLRRPDAYRPRAFQNCIVTKEWTVLERGAIEFKTYCPNIGNVLTVEHHGKVVRTELVAIEHQAAIRRPF